MLREATVNRIGIVAERAAHGAGSGANRGPDTRSRSNATTTYEDADTARRRTNRSAFRTVLDDLIVRFRQARIFCKLQTFTDIALRRRAADRLQMRVRLQHRPLHRGASVQRDRQRGSHHSFVMNLGVARPETGSGEPFAPA